MYDDEPRHFDEIRDDFWKLTGIAECDTVGNRCDIRWEKSWFWDTCKYDLNRILCRFFYVDLESGISGKLISEYAGSDWSTHSGDYCIYSFGSTLYGRRYGNGTL